MLVRPILGWPWTFLFCLSASGFELPENTENNSTVKCERDYVNNMNIAQVLGKWYVLEIYSHLRKEGVIKFASCPIIILWEASEMPRTTFGPSTQSQPFHVQHLSAKFKHENRYLRLLWNEAGNTIEYSLTFRNDSMGYWKVFDGQNGTLVNRASYQQFSGSVQVLKAVHDHLVLNFCQEEARDRPAQLYSVLFARKPAYMSHRDLELIHNFLQNKKLSVASRRIVCENSADRPFYSLILSILTCMIAVVIGS